MSLQCCTRSGQVSQKSLPFLPLLPPAHFPFLMFSLSSLPPSPSHSSSLPPPPSSSPLYATSSLPFFLSLISSLLSSFTRPTIPTLLKGQAEAASPEECEVIEKDHLILIGCRYVYTLVGQICHTCSCILVPMVTRLMPYGYTVCALYLEVGMTSATHFFLFFFLFYFCLQGLCQSTSTQSRHIQPLARPSCGLLLLGTGMNVGYLQLPTLSFFSRSSPPFCFSSICFPLSPLR